MLAQGTPGTVTTSRWLAAALTTSGVPFNPNLGSAVFRYKDHDKWHFHDSGTEGTPAVALMNAWNDPGVSSELDAQVDKLCNHADAEVRRTGIKIRQLRNLDHMVFMHAAFLNAERLPRVKGKRMVRLGPWGKYKQVVIEERPSEATKRSLRL